jgi:dihydrofolate reductase
MSRKVILYIASSLDGYIAGENDDLSFLAAVHKEGEDYGYHAFIESVDTVILGRKTYQWVMGQVATFPHADKTSYILTRTPRPSIGTTHFYTGDPGELIRNLKSEPGAHIFCDGGAEVVHTLMKENLIDEIILSVIPVLLGKGIQLFKDGRPELPLRLLSCKQFDTGLVQLHYAHKNT